MNYGPHYATWLRATTGWTYFSGWVCLRSRNEQEKNGTTLLLLLILLYCCAGMNTFCGDCICLPRRRTHRTITISVNDIQGVRETEGGRRKLIQIESIHNTQNGVTEREAEREAEEAKCNHLIRSQANTDR